MTFLITFNTNNYLRGHNFTAFLGCCLYIIAKIIHNRMIIGVDRDLHHVVDTMMTAVVVD